MSEITENKITDSKLQYRIELFSALIITGIVCAAGSSNLLFASNDLYPAATDAMGHMAKVQYITQCLKGGVIPSWFPYWYNGAAVTQYYPPLSYYLMVPVYALTGNVMLTFKINCFLMMFIGGMGVWYFCRKVIGKWCGCIAIVFYCLQPFLLSSLYIVGVLAQGPVYAITPWLLYLVLSFIKEPNRQKALFCT
ncbi:MAG TPA: 6-pyruvoyl-tetrahydropterin synthase-related protein, partial [Bacillota bacterium]|nr:6-pyruvoyl-tetrahydropterin synthase-related protein [Bacillota bacterium]